MRWLPVVVVAVALVAAGCGDSDDKSAALDEATVEETLTSDETTTGTGAGEATDFTDEDCRALAAAIVRVSLGAAAALTGSPEDFSEEVAVLSEYADRVPEEFQADVRILETGYSEYIDALQEAGLEPGETPTAEQRQRLLDALQDVGSEDVTAAYERLNAWGTENCRD